MKLAVCLKEVVGRDTRYDLEPSAKWIREDHVSFEIGECDEYALEAALRLGEKLGGEVLIVCVGVGRAERVVRKGLAMGADRAILVVDEERRLDGPFPTASALASVLAEEKCDLVLTGAQSDDFGYGQTGVMLAELLGVPHASLVMEIDVAPDGTRVRLVKELEGGWFQNQTVPLPALVTVQAGISPVRYVSLKGIMQAKKKEIRKVGLDELEKRFEDLPGLEVRRLRVPVVDRKAEIFEGDIEAAVEHLVDRLLREAKVL